MKLAISIVVFKSDSDLLAGTLRSLSLAVGYAKHRIPELHCRLCIIENERIEQQGLRQADACLADSCSDVFDEIELKVSAVNLGFGRAHNNALASGAPGFHLVLNPDVSLSQDSLYVGLSYFQDNARAVLLTPKVTGAQGENLFPCKRYPAIFDLMLRGFAPQWLKRSFVERLSHYEMRALSAANQAVTDIEIASGCCMLVRSEALESVGGFDERFFLYFEDFDLSLRLRRQGELVYLPSMQIIHYGGHAARKGLKHILLFGQSAWKFYQRHGWRWF